MLINGGLQFVFNLGKAIENQLPFAFLQMKRFIRLVPKKGMVLYMPAKGGAMYYISVKNQSMPFELVGFAVAAHARHLPMGHKPSRDTPISSSNRSAKIHANK